MRFDQLIIRDRKKDDYQFIHDLTRENMGESFAKYWGGWNEAVFKKGYETGIFKVAEFKGRKIGFFCYEVKFSDHVFIWNLQVSTSMQNQGIGTYLMKFIENEVKPTTNKIRLRVFKDNPALRLYRRLGYTKQIKDEGPSIILEKEI